LCLGAILLLVAFVRKKRIDGVEYHYLVQGTRIDGKVKQRVVAYLGKHRTVEAAYLHWAREGRKRGRKQYATKMMKTLEPFL
jgi:hypothetical protein